MRRIEAGLELHDRLRLGDLAKRLVADEAWQAARQLVREDIAAEILGTAEDQAREREQLYHEHRALERLETRLHRLLASGQEAEAEIRRRESR